MGEQMLRAVLETLEQKGRLKICRTRVSPKYELGAVLSHFRNEQPILFSDVKGSGMAVAGGLYGKREILYELLDTTREERIHKIMRAIAAPAQPVMAACAPVQERVEKGRPEIRKLLPVPTSYGGDSGPFLTAGIFVYRDDETGKIQAAVRRFQVNSGNRINVLVSPASPHLLRILERYRETRKELECAVILGYDAYLLLASQISSEKYGLDTYEIDSALRGEPLELTGCRSVFLEVPARAEVILEGRIRPGAEGPEGPFAELMGYYSRKGISPVMEVTVVTSRSDAIFQHCFPCREEHLAYGMVKEAETYAALAPHIDVRDVNYTLGGGCRLHAAVSIRKRSPGDGKSAILTVLGNDKDVKHAVIVDEDVDIFDPADLEGAIASRFQASTGLVVVPGAMGSALEPSYYERQMSDKMGFDATKPLGDRRKNYDRAVIPGYDGSFDIRKYIPD